MSKKTSFKDLLAKGGSNPLVNLQGLKQQRRKIDELKHGEEPASKRQAVAASAGVGKPSVARTAPATPASSAFVPSPTFAGARPGYTFKAGPRGIGYYPDAVAGDAAAPKAAAAAARAGPGPGVATAGKAGAGGAGPAGGAGEPEPEDGAALPGDFFDNPQNDPANRGREVAATHKEQQLRDEMDEFNRLVSVDVVASKINDEEELEEEAEATELEVLQEQVQLNRRVDQLRDMRGKALAMAARVAAEVAQTKARQPAEAAAVDGEESEDEDEEGDGGLSALDWRARRVG